MAAALFGLLAVGGGDFSLVSYWDAVYANPSTAEEEWLCPVDEAVMRLRPLIGWGGDGRKLLVPGSGLSRLGEVLASEGWEVTNIDYSQICIDEGISRAQTEGNSRVKWLRMDMRALDFESGAMDAVVDKGALDSLMCSDGFDVEVPRYIAEVSRILAPRGMFVAISLSQEKVAGPLLEAAFGEDWLVRAQPFGKRRVFVAHRTVPKGTGARALP